MMKLLKTLQKELARNKMTFADIMPVAGVDKGTLERRFDTDFSRGSVVGKTGTLGNTDGGVSTLAGEMQTNKGKFLFVIFNQRGSVARFRSFQNSSGFIDSRTTRRCRTDNLYRSCARSAACQNAHYLSEHSRQSQ